MGLAGDSGDNIPGVPGIGPKTAQRLIKEFGSIENLLSALDRVSKEKERQRLETHSEQAIMSLALATIKCDVPLEKDWQEFELGEADLGDLINLYRELEFKKLLQELEGTQTSVEPEAIRRDYQLVTTTDGLEQILSQIRQSPRVALSVMISDEGSFGSDLVGLALAWGPEQGCYLPLSHQSESSSASLDQSVVMRLLAPILSDPRVQKVIHNMRMSWILARGCKIWRSWPENILMCPWLLSKTWWEPAKSGAV
jgi:DNA polymerase-1